MGNFFYYYKLKYYFDANEQTAEGFTFGNTWKEVMEHLVSYYGENEMVDILSLVVLGEGGNCIELDEINNDLAKKHLTVKKIEEE